MQREIVETEQKLKALEKQASESSVALLKIAATGESLKSAGDKVSSVGENMLSLVGCLLTSMQTRE